MIDFLTGIISDLIDWLGNLSIGDILSGTVGVIARGVIFIRLLFNPIYDIVNGTFGLYTALLFVSVTSFIVILALRRGVTK